MSLTHKCGPGQIWDPKAGRCIPIVKGSLYKSKNKKPVLKKKSGRKK